MNRAAFVKILRLSTLGASVAFALTATPTEAAGLPSGGKAGPVFLTKTNCVLNRLGAGDCIIAGTVGTTTLNSLPAQLLNGSISDGLPTDKFPDMVSGSMPGAASQSYVADATLTAASITGTSDVSILGYGCNNTATSSGATDPCYIDVAVRPGGVVGGVLQGELTYTYSAVSNTLSDSFVQTGVTHPDVGSYYEFTTASPPPAPAGQLLVDNGPVAPSFAYEWDYYDINPADEVPVGYDSESDRVYGSVTVDPPVQTYITPEVGGVYSDPGVFGSDGQEVGDAGVLGSNLPSSFGLTTGSSGGSVPEPTTFGLLGLGVLAVVFRRKRSGVVGV